MKRPLSLILALVMLVGMLPMNVIAVSGEDAASEQNPFAGKTVSILGDSISTFSGVSNNSKHNQTLNKNVGFYPVNDVITQGETWWQQVIDTLGMELCVNNSSGGGRILSDEKLSAISNGTFTSSARNVAAYKDRCVNLHNTKGDKPDVILVFLGTNDFSYHLDPKNCEACKTLAACTICQGTNTCETCVTNSGLNPSFCTQSLGTADINANLIAQNQDGTFAYLTPQTTCEAYAIMLHKMKQMYPDADIFCMGLLARRDPDYSGGYHDHGQPTAFNNEIKKIVERFGATFVDLENCGIEKEAAVFDPYIYDKAVHPNAAGMDKITDAVISAMLGNDVALYKVSANLTNAKLDGNSGAYASTAYTAKLTPLADCPDVSVAVTMGGVDITASVYADGVITIPCVTGDVVITAVGIPRAPQNFRWEFDGNNLVSVGEDKNSLTKRNGSVANGLFSNTRYRLEKAIVLRHDRAWVLEWKGEGAGGFMLSKDVKTNDGNKYFFHRANNTLEAFGYWNLAEKRNNNYGVSLEKVIDTGSHKYRLENRIAADGSNMVYLIVDDQDAYRLDHFFYGGAAQGTTGDWISGQDFIFNYIGTEELPLTNYKIDYLAVWENGQNHVHHYDAVVTAPTCTEQGYTTYTCGCGESYVDSYVDTLGHSFENGTCSECGEEDPDATAPTTDIDLFVFAGQSNMMGASVLEPEVDTFTDKALEYKYIPRLRGAETGAFVPAQNPAGEWHYKDMNAAYGDRLYDLSYKATVSNYSSSTYFCPAMRNGTKGFSAQSEADTYPAASLPPYFVTEYASYGHSCVYAHMAKGAVKIVHYFTEEMMTRYNSLISEYNTENSKSYSLLTPAGLSGAGDAFDDKYNAMLEDYAAFAPDKTLKNKCFVWLQGEGDSGNSYMEYKLKLQVLWEHLQELGFTHFFVLRVGYWGSTGILNVIKAQEDFCAENENCYIVTRAPSLIPYPGATTANWWISEPSAEYDGCRDSYLVDSSNHHFNEKAMQIFAERAAQNIHRVLYLGLDPILEEENIQGMPTQTPDADEDTTPYTSYTGTEVFCNSLSVSKKSDQTWAEQAHATAASTDLIPVSSADSVWLQYIFFKSEAHAVGGFYDADGNLVAPLYFKDFGFAPDANTGGVTAFRTPEAGNRVSVAAVEAATGKKVAFVRFTAWQASAGGHANTEARIYHHYSVVVTDPTCTEQGYTTYTCACGDGYVADYVDALGHSYENGTCIGCGETDPAYHIPGDINGDGDVNNKDLTRLFKYLTGYDVEVEEAALDVNGDGVVNNKDQTRLFRYLSGWDVTIY